MGFEHAHIFLLLHFSNQHFTLSKPHLQFLAPAQRRFKYVSNFINILQRFLENGYCTFPDCPFFVKVRSKHIKALTDPLNRINLFQINQSMLFTNR